MYWAVAGFHRIQHIGRHCTSLFHFKKHFVGGGTLLIPVKVAWWHVKLKMTSQV